MLKLKKIITIALLILLSATPLLTGCILFGSAKLGTPNLKWHDGTTVITWDTIANAESYDVYCNSMLKATINTSDNVGRIFDFASLLKEDGGYSFYVVAKADDYESSSPSNVVTYLYTSKSVAKSNAEYTLDSDGVNDITFDITGKIVDFESTETEVDNYLIYLYSTDTGLNKYALTDMSDIDLSYSIYGLRDEIYAIRMGYTKNSVDYISSDIKYMNPDNQSPYSDNIYVFDGYINDMYIESLQELDNLIYYSFINRMTSFNIKISPKFYSVVNSGFNGPSFSNKLDEAISYSFNQFYETMAFAGGYAIGEDIYTFTKIIDATNRIYNIKVDYYGVTECDTSISPKISALATQAEYIPYYETSGYTMLGSEYDSFVSDKQYLTTICNTSEQLYWAVENDITPVFESTSSRAYVIYEEAKDVLRSIISEDMTDYEKALSIFDYISINTIYDTTIYTVANGYPINYSEKPMLLPCFYLEGVFMTGYSVCDGFSKAYSLMCNMLGIDAIREVGIAYSNGESGGHAWNKVLIDVDERDNTPAEYYIVDITWTEMNIQYSQLEREENHTHSYFMLNEDDVKDTHIRWANRTKFNDYEAKGQFKYYLDSKYTYEETDYNYVIDSDSDLTAMFNYMVDSAVPQFEVIFDLNYMIDYFDSVNGRGSYSILYNIYGDVEYATLKSAFISKLKECKFKEQYIFIFSATYLTKYGSSDEQIGLIYTFTQNLLVDEGYNEIEDIVDRLKEKNIQGKFTLYILNDILKNGIGVESVAKVYNLFTTHADASGLNLHFELIDSNYVMEIDGSQKYATIFELTVSQ